MFKEFATFIKRGNVLDLAVAVIIGAAFGKIVTSFVNDLLMPVIGLLLGNADFANLFITLKGDTYPTLAAAKEAGAVTLNYGLFLNTIIDFLLIAFAIFLIIRAFNKMKAQPEPAPVDTKECPHCLSTVPLKATRCPQCTSELKAG